MIFFKYLYTKSHITEMIYGHFDIEADGPSPATSNMISLGIVFTDETGTEIDTFQVDLCPRDGFRGNEDTLNWWKHPDRITEYTRIMNDGILPALAMAKFDEKIRQYPKIKWVARPAAYDWMWLKFYHDLYCSLETGSDIGFSAICLSSIRTIWKNLKGYTTDQAETVINEWTVGLGMSHNPLDDARYQAKVYHMIVNDLDKYQSPQT